ncbi:uncharacterized protein At3g60930, chloroplastic-like [Eutrema salsugineum]|uniref:uncharacterized protein At3g60930, chloroplastic-like n=1 Tax=Eutrema salsugineum TaxID=72664 RepID=UPI000CED5901|nr:uncharacterized protein At3g60930, chloroplastic-like [Eutrema salsugineum]
MSNHSVDSLDPLFNYEPSRVDAEVRGVTGSSEASISPSPSNRSSEADKASNRSNPSGAPSRNNEPLVSTSCPRGPAYNKDVDYAAVKAEEEAFPFDPVEAKLELERLMASRVRSILPPVPDDLFVVRDSLAARRVNWRKHFTFERVERARAIFARVPVSSSSSNSSGDTREKIVIITLRDRKRHEEEEAAKRAAEVARTKAEAIPQEIRHAVKGKVWRQSRRRWHPRWNLAKSFPRRPKTTPRLRSSSPSASHLQKHDSGRKRSATDKGKGVAIQKNEPAKKKRKPVSGDPASRKLVVDDPDASAIMFARVNNANTRLPEQLRRPRSYGAMAQHGTKFVAAINEQMVEYEADLSKVERRLEEARNEAATTKGKLEEAITRAKKLEEEKIALRADVDKVSAEVALLKRQIEAKDASFDTKVKRAKKEARRELTAKFQERLAKVEEGLAKLEKAKTDENELGQINDLRKPDGLTLDDEEAKVKGWESEYVDDEVYERIASEIRGELVFSPVSPDSVDTGLGNKPIEETAPNLGVVDPTRSNVGTPALSNLLAERETQSAA